MTARLDGTLQIYAKFAAADPLEEPMRVSPAVHAGMGGLWVDFKKDEKTGGLRVGEPSNMSTNIAGLYAMGEASVAYHGANRLGGNGLLSRLFDGLFGGACVKNYCEESRSEAPQAAFDSVIKQETDRIARLLSNDGEEGPSNPGGTVAGDDRPLHGDPPQRQVAIDTGQMPGMERLQPANEADRQRQSDESKFVFHPLRS